MAMVVCVASFVHAATELFPGHVFDPNGRQANMTIAYNSDDDFYLLGYSNGRALVNRLGVDGSFVIGNQIAVSANTGVSAMELAYNPDRNEFLYVWRNSDDSSIRGRYLDSLGNPLGSEIAVGNGKKPHVDYGTGDQRYVVTFAKPGGIIRYKTLDGDSTNPNPILNAGDVSTSNAVGDVVHYGSVSNQFLVAYVRDFAPNARRADLFGRFIAGDGMSLGPEFGINTSTADQNSPVLSYSTEDDHWVVGYQSWQRSPPDLNVAVIEPNRTISQRFKVASAAAWEVVGGIGYNEITDTFVFGWRHATNALTDARAQEWEIRDGPAQAVGPQILLSDDDPGVQGAASRSVADDPQVTFLWRVGTGGDGIHAGIVHIAPPPPDLTPPAPVTDLSGSTGGPDLLVAPITAIEASDAQSSHPKEDSTDGDFVTYWGTRSDTTLEEETITWDVGSIRNISSVVLWSRPAGDLFPEDYHIEVSEDGNTYQTVASVSGAVVPQGTSITHEFSPTPAQFVRLRVTKPRQTGTGKYRVQLAEVQIFEADMTPGLITVTFTAPGDDGNDGTATSYDLRWSENPISEANFGSANAVGGLPAPKPAGNPETIQISGLPDEDQIYLAVKATDDNGNTSDISNLPPPVNTPGIPPAPVDDLVASNPGGDSADLDWSATGDDGLIGTASSYDLRWATFPIDESNFDSANPIAVPFAPGPPGTGESLTVSGLPAETTVYFGIKVLDELMNASAADITATEPMVTTLDLVPPGPITDLRESPSGSSPELVAAPAIDSSGEEKAAKGPEMATDGDEISYWATPLRNSLQNEFITLDTGGVRNIVQVRALSRSAGSLFPEDLEIQVSDSPTSGFVTVASFSGLPDTQGMWHTFDLPPSTGRYVRVWITKPRTTGTGDFKVQIAELEVYESPIVFGEVTLLWTAPGDNGDLGQAQSYELRWSENPITALNFDSANPFPIPPPQPAGAEERLTVTGLPNETMVYFAMTTSDEVPLTSLISNVADATTAGVAPAAVSDLAVSGTTGSTADLTWIATGDDGTSGTASAYDIRISTSPINEGNFDAATPVSGSVPAPQAPGTPQGMTVTNLDDDTLYFFAIKVIDDVGNESTLQTNGDVAASTPDITPPGQVTELQVMAADPTVTLEPAPAVDSSGDLKTAKGKEMATDSDPVSYWNSRTSSTQQDEYITVDLGSAKTVSRVRVLSRSAGTLFPEDLEIQVSDAIDSGFFTVFEAMGLPDTQGLWHTFDFPAVSGRYVRIYITNTRATSTGVFQAQIAEIDVYSSQASGSLMLTWPSPGDDPGIGSPTAYDVRFSNSEINASNFGSATPLDGEPVPQSFGLQESFTVAAPEEGTTVHFALVAMDDVGNVSMVSNDASFLTEITAPSPVFDLQATLVTSLSARLEWTATGDDGAIGTASAYDVRISTSEINAGNFDAATPVPGAPTPSAPGTVETMTVTGLSTSTQYYIAMKVKDETGTPEGTSSISNVITFTTEPPDAIAPSAINDLRGSTPVSLSVTNAPAVDVSSQVKAAKGMGAVTDGDPASYWETDTSPVMQPEWITFDLGSAVTFSRVRLLSRPAGSLFPEDVEIQVSDVVDSGFVTVHQETGLPDTQEMWHTLDFTAVTGRFVRINLTKLRQSVGGFRSQISEIEIYEAEFLAGPITLSFTAPGDDGAVGTASAYDVRWSVNPIDAGNFNGANPLAVAAPSEAGTIESISLPGLPTGSDIYFAIKAHDEVPNIAPISNVISVFNPNP